MGERLFLKTRFAEFFHRNFDGNVNHPLLSGNPTSAQLSTPAGPINGPFAGKSTSCRSCHLVDDASGASTSTYGDYARRLRDAGEGLRIFLREPPADPRVRAVRVGNRLTCHAPPHFTDFALHNTGASQDEYDSIPGDGSFGRADVGAWNVFANPDVPAPQLALRSPLASITLGEDDVAPLAAFLRSLNEDYD